MSLAPGRTLMGAAAGIAAVTVAARVVGFGRTAVFTNAVGINCVSNTYQVVNAVPNVVFEVVAGGALASLVVPVLAPALHAGDHEQASRTASALLTWTLLLLVPAALLGLLVAPLLVRGLLGGSSCGPAAQSVGIGMLRVFLPQVVLYGVAVVLTGVLQAHRRFLGPALAPLLSSLVVAAAYVLYALRGGGTLDQLPRSQQLVLSVGTTLGVAVLAFSLLVPLRGTGLRLRPAVTFPPGIARQARGLAGAGVAGLAAQQLALVVALRLGSGAAPDGAVLFTTATALFLLPWAVLAVPIATSAFPRLSAAQEPEYAHVAGRALQAVVLLCLAGSAVLAAAALPVARLLGGGSDLAEATRAFAPGLLGYGLLALLGRALYARGQGRAAGAATVVGWLSVAVADVVLVAGTDLRPATALGLGNAVGMTGAAGLLLAALHRISPRSLAGAARTAGSGVLAAVLAVVAAGAIPEPANSSVVTSLALAAGLAVGTAVVYAAVLAIVDRSGLRALRDG